MDKKPDFIEYVESLDKNLYRLPLYLGIDKTESPVVSDFTRIGNIIMLGAEGTGKTMFAHTTVCSLISSFSPEYLEIALIDLANPEFSSYDGLPHLASTPVYNSREAITLLSSMSNTVGNKYQIILIDTFSKLVIDYGVILNDILKKLASRKNTFLIMWDSKPYEEIFTPEIKKLFSSRILFGVGRDDAEKILTSQTLEDIPTKKGEAMVFTKTNSEPIFVQCPYISEEEILNIVNSVK